MNTANSFKQRDVLTEFIEETHMSEQQEQTINEQYLLDHGFFQYDHIVIARLPIGVPQMLQPGTKHFIEKDIHRQMFVVVIDYYGGQSDQTVYVQQDVGCGFVEIPFPWSDLSVEFFEAVYYGIRGHKPKQV